MIKPSPIVTASILSTQHRSEGAATEGSNPSQVARMDTRGRAWSEPVETPEQRRRRLCYECCGCGRCLRQEKAHA